MIFLGIITLLISLFCWFVIGVAVANFVRDTFTSKWVELGFGLAVILGASLLPDLCIKLLLA